MLCPGLGVSLRSFALGSCEGGLGLVVLAEFGLDIVVDSLDLLYEASV
jgi:hypothetical protein